VGLKNGEVKIQDFEFVKDIEESIQIAGIQLCSVDHGTCKIQIMSFLCSICNFGEVSMQDRVANRPQLHNKTRVLGCRCKVFDL